MLTHWGRVTHICVSKLTTIGSDNGLSPGRRQAIIWTNDGILLFRTLGTNFSEILSEIHSFSFKKMHLKMSSAKWRLFLLGLNELIRPTPYSSFLLSVYTDNHYDVLIHRQRLSHLPVGIYISYIYFYFSLCGAFEKVMNLQLFVCFINNSSPPSAAYMHQWTGSALVQIMACRLIGTKPLSEPLLEYYQLYP